MSLAYKSPLLNFLAGNTTVGKLNAEDFSLLMADARACGLLGRLAQTLLTGPQAGQCSLHVREQLLAATIHSQGFKQDVCRELAHIERALFKLKIPVILLKGASYVHLGLPAGDGRIFSDIDILVSKDQLPHAEAALMLGGWAIGKLDPYDQRYYREWSHEIPPMTHLRRGTTIDLHHSLVMPTCLIKVDSKRMTEAAIPASSEGFWYRLRDEDMVLHAVSHLMLNSEFDRGLRDLWDIDHLYRHFTSLADDFPARLLLRAREVGLDTLLRQVLYLTCRFFGTSIPNAMKSENPGLSLRLLTLSASVRHPDTRPRGQGIADFALILREMYIRLPPDLLVIHLWHKFSDLFKESEKSRP